MLHKTRGIVFHVTAFSESSVVAKIYTELFGLQSYLINGVRNKPARLNRRSGGKSKTKLGLLQPLSLVEIVAYHKEREGLQRIKEIRSAAGGFTSIPFDVMKSSMIMFINEVIYKSVKEEEGNQQLFDFIFHAMQLLDISVHPDVNFHFRFLIQLTKYLGFFPNGAYSELTPFFNLQEGTFQKTEPVHPYYISFPLSQHFSGFVNASLSDVLHPNISVTQKRELMEKLLQYYSLHVTGFNNVQSHKVLEEVWS